VFRLATNALICGFLAAAAQAQVTTSRVNVLITGLRCNELQNVFLVVDGADAEERWIRLEKEPRVCRWTADLGGSFSTKLSRFSLRFDLGRSDCRQAAPNEAQLSGELEFTCCAEEPLRNIHVKTEPPLPVSYVRKVPKHGEARVHPIDCTEVGAFLGGNGWIRHAQLSGEDIYLQFGTTIPQRRMFGLPLNDLVVHGDALTLTRDGVVHYLIVHRAKGKTSGPTFSSNAISLDIKKLGEAKLERIELEVIK